MVGWGEAERVPPACTCKPPLLPVYAWKGRKQEEERLQPKKPYWSVVLLKLVLKKRTLGLYSPNLRFIGSCFQPGLQMKRI